MKKQCSRCKEVKEYSEFNKESRTPTGLKYHCKECGKKEYQGNKEKRKKQVKEWQQANKDKVAKQKKVYWEKYKPKYQQRCKQRKDEINARARERYHNDPIYKLRQRLKGYASRVTKRAKEHSKSTAGLKYLGCTLEEFKTHIESLWEEGMTWENHGTNGWHIDHVVPIDWYINNSDDPWQANHYTNLQPLWAKENLSKNNKIK